MFSPCIIVYYDCVAGKLGLDALEIFSALEEAQGKGVVNFKPGDFVPLIRSGTVQLSSIFLFCKTTAAPY